MTICMSIEKNRVVKTAVLYTQRAATAAKANQTNESVSMNAIKQLLSMKPKKESYPPGLTSAMEGPANTMQGVVGMSKRCRPV